MTSSPRGWLALPFFLLGVLFLFPAVVIRSDHRIDLPLGTLRDSVAWPFMLAGFGFAGISFIIEGCWEL